MPIKSCPFTVLPNGTSRPILPIKITNPHSQRRLTSFGVIDTGADECAVPANYALLLGHNLQAGQPKQIMTGNGITIAYSHITRFEIYHPITHQLAYVVDDTPIDFLPNLQVVLLGVRNFLNKFVLTVNYPRLSFSLELPNSL